jgi:hypothetical protein
VTSVVERGRVIVLRSGVLVAGTKLIHMVAVDVQGDRRATSSPPSRVVLVVDTVSEVMAMMLEDLGCEVLTASTGNEVLSILAQKHVDCPDC